MARPRSRPTKLKPSPSPLGELAFWNAHHDERGFASMHINKRHAGGDDPASGGQSGAPLSPHRRVLADGWRARRDFEDEPARQQLPTSCPEGVLFPVAALGLMPAGP
jgi:hypothetical protein